MLHKFYYIEGGAERYVFNLSDLLTKQGHSVIPFAMQDDRNFETPYRSYFVSNFQPDHLHNTRNPLKRLKLARRTVYSREAQVKLAQLIKDTKPDIAHVHSIYHHLSPSVLHTLKQNNLPVMLTLHDYKLVCPNYIFLNGKRRVCEACKGKYYWNAVTQKCFRDSYGASVLVAAEAYVNSILKSYKNNVDVLTAPSHFLGNKVWQYGYQHIPVKIQPYTLDVNAYQPCFEDSNYFVFMGRLTHEKGLHFLLDAMHHIQGAGLYICGTGPIEHELRERIDRESLDHVKMLGYKSGDELRKIVSHAKFTVIPSEWHDNSPLVIYESQSLGNPMIGSRMGGIPELINEDVDGYTFDRGDMHRFVKLVNELVQDPEKCRKMGKNARQKAETQYAFAGHYPKIMNLYEYTRRQSEKHSES